MMHGTYDYVIYQMTPGKQGIAGGGIHKAAAVVLSGGPSKCPQGHIFHSRKNELENSSV